MSLGIERNVLSFLILDTANPKTFVFIDTSHYFEQPDRPLLEITPPGFNKYFLVNIVAQNVNTLNSNTIGLSDVIGTSCLEDLADGVWILKYKICPYDEIFTIQYHLRTTKLENSLRSLYHELDFSDCDVAEDEDLKKDIIDIQLAIASGKANAEEGNIKEASTLYQIANNLVTKRINKLSNLC